MGKKVFPVKKGDKIDLQISGVNHRGQGVGRYMGAAIFVSGAVPGERVLAEVEELKKSYAVGRLLEIVHPSPDRRDPSCPIYHSCGGCRLQHLDYREQLRLKTGLVRDSITRIGGLGEVPVRDTAGMENPWHYRNKAHYQVAEAGGRLVLGFYQEGSHSLAPFPESGDPYCGCLLVDRDLNRVAALVEKLINRHRVNGDNRGEKFFRHVVLRKGFFTGEIMAVLVTGGREWPGEDHFVSDLMSLQSGITSLVRNINDGPPGPVMGNKNRLLAGREYITDRLEELTFIISPDSFYQVNPVQTSVLYKKAMEYAALTEGKGATVVDAYSGIGTIALYMAGRAKLVYALEVVPEAVDDARKNASLNGLGNVRFHRGEVEKILPSLAAGGLRPDVVVLDPPRRGCGREVLEAVSAMEVSRVVYISCDPGTLARDLGLLSGMGYRVEEVQPVDMFPWTHHCEAVARIERPKG